MALLHALQLWRGTHSASTFTTVYTVPLGNRVILKNAQVLNTGGSAQQAVVGVNGIDMDLISLDAFGGANAARTRTYWMVLLPGDTIGVRNGGGVTMDWVISGSIYTI